MNPLYYVTFTTCTLLASFILFGGFNTTDTVNTISLLCGFLIIFTGVYLLNLSREDPDGMELGIRKRHADGLGNYAEVDGIPTDGLTGLQTRLSMQARRSEDGTHNHSRTNSWTMRSPIVSNGFSGAVSKGAHGQDHLMHSYDVEANNLGDLAEDSEEESGNGNKRTSFDDGGIRSGPHVKHKLAKGRKSGEGSNNSRRTQNGGTYGNAPTDFDRTRW